jgi:ParB family transcriptional regulator, chromosome partitioning protein
MQDMKHAPSFQLVDPNFIRPSPWNANVVSQENEEKLKASIERHGMFKPILVRDCVDTSTGEIELQCIGGWHRCEQAIGLGYTEVPVINLGPIDDDKAKEISLADNARYGIDDTLKLSELLGDLDTSALENILPWSSRDISAMTASLSVNIDDLDLDQPDISDDDEEEAPETPKPSKTHQLLRFRCGLDDAARISGLINKTMEAQGFTTADGLTNAGDALAFLLFGEEQDDD